MTTLRWDCYVALAVGGALAAAVADFWIFRESLFWNHPSLFNFLDGIGLPGDCVDSGMSVSVAKVLACFLFYGFAVFAPFRIEDFLVGTFANGASKIWDIRIVRTSAPMLLITSAYYGKSRFLPSPPHGVDSGVGDAIVTSWFGPLLAISAPVALAAGVHIAYRKLRVRRR